MILPHAVGRRIQVICVGVWVLAVGTIAGIGQVPQLISYQGRVVVGSTNFNGSGQFKFALVNTNGSTTYWSNDGTSVAGSQPTAAVTLNVAQGLYSLQLGDTTLTNMTAIPNSVFSNSDVRLRVWFNDGTDGFQLLSPDQRIAAVGYAMMAGSVPNGSITSAQIANGAVGPAQLANGAIGSVQLSPSLVLAPSMIPNNSANTTGSAGSVTLSGVTGTGTGVTAAAANPTNAANGLLALDENALAPLNAWSINLDGQAFVFEGDSITANPNGSGNVSYTYLAQSLPFYQNHGTYLDEAVGGSMIASGDNNVATLTANGTPSTTAKTITGLTNTTQLVVGQLVTGTGIPSNTFVMSVSGNSITVNNQPTVGTSETLTFYPGNITDRYMTFVYPHRPAAKGGDGGPRAILYVMAGTNPLHQAETASKVMSDLTTYTTRARSDGFYVVLSTILPGFNSWFSTSTEANRETVNTAIRQYQIPCDLMIDNAQCLAGPATLFDGLGVHPNATANTILAFYLNSQMISDGSNYAGSVGYVDSSQEFEDNVTVDGSETANTLTGTNVFAPEYNLTPQVLTGSGYPTVAYGSYISTYTGGNTDIALPSTTSATYSPGNIFEFYNATTSQNTVIVPASGTTITYNPSYTPLVITHSGYAVIGPGEYVKYLLDSTGKNWVCIQDTSTANELTGANLNAATYNPVPSVLTTSNTYYSPNAGGTIIDNYNGVCSMYLPSSSSAIGTIVNIIDPAGTLYVTSPSGQAVNYGTGSTTAAYVISAGTSLEMMRVDSNDWDIIQKTNWTAINNPSMTPNTTGTITFNTSGNSETQYNSSTSSISNATITLPSTGLAGQTLTYVGNGAISALTITGGTQDAGPTLPTTLPANTVLQFQEDNTTGHYVRLK